MARVEGPQLITYADRLAGSIPELAEVMAEELGGAFAGVHILPFFTPYDGADAGFDPVDHTQVDPRLGAWPDVAVLSGSATVMADVIVNHVSVESQQFQDVVARGDASPYAPMFLTMSSLWPDGATEEELAAIYRPRPGLPFTPMVLGGVKRLVWTTFTPQQIDLDVRADLTWQYLTDVIDALTGAGVTMLRLDAIGYAGKKAGTSCFMTSDTLAFIQKVRAYAASRGARVLLEIHGHYLQPIEAARTVDFVYDFALPPLVIHALTTADAGPLTRWFEVRPPNVVTVLDTHDGIGIVDVGPAGEKPGLLTATQLDALVETIHANSGGSSRKATGAAASNLDLYQVNCTFFDALGADERRYASARAIQLFTPGIPQLYYVGLLAGHNDLELLARTGVGRDINRHYYTRTEVRAAVATPLVRAILALVRLRRDHPAFTGRFSYETSGSTLRLAWAADGARLELTIELDSGGGVVVGTRADGTEQRADLLDADAIAALL